MEPLYLDEDLSNWRAGIIDKVLQNVFVVKELPKDITKKRGGLNEITDLREQTAKLLNVPIGQVYGLTKGWSKNNLRDTLKTCNNFVNPPALWWKIYNEKKDTFRQSSKKVLLRDGKNRRRNNKEKDGQKALF